MKKVLPILLAVAANTAYADEKIEEIIVTSSRVEQPLREVGTSVSVLTEEDITTLGAMNVGEVLRTLPGVALSNAGGMGKSSTLRIRGEEGYRTLVLIDGMEVTDPSTPQAMPQIQHIMTSGLSRIEVLRGPQGMMYGADAGGVVNISTQQPARGINGDVSVEAGRYNSVKEFAQVGGGNEHVDFYLSGLNNETDGFNARTTDLPPADQDGYENRTYHGRAGVNITERLRLDAVARHVSGENQYDACFGTGPTDDCRNDYDQFSRKLSGQWDGENLMQSLSLEQTDIERTSFADQAFSFEYQGEIQRAKYLGSVVFSEPLQFVYGIEHKQELFESTFNTQRERDQLGYFVEYQGAFTGGLSLTAGVRQDDNDDFGEHTSSRLTVAQMLPAGPHQLKLKSSYSTGFRAPSLYEVGLNEGFPGTIPALQEEQSEGYDLGIEAYFANGAQAELVYFDQRVEDKIFYFFNPATFTGYYRQQQGESRSHGWELAGELPLYDRLTLRGNYTYTDAEQVDDSPRVLRPKHQANLAFDAQLIRDTLLMSLAWRYSDDAMDSTGTVLDDYRVTSISARYSPIESLEVSARIENVFDRDYVEVATYNTTGRAGYLGVNYHF